MNERFSGISQKNSCPKWAKCYNSYSEHDCPECKGFKSYMDGILTWDATEEGSQYFKKIRQAQHIKDAINAKRRKQYARRKKK